MTKRPPKIAGKELDQAAEQAPEIPLTEPAKINPLASSLDAAKVAG